MAFQGNAFQGSGFQIGRFGGVPPIVEITPNGNGRREYQPTYHELRNQREIERRFEEAQLSLKSTEIKIEQLEFKRLSDLADRAMQLELLQLVAQQHEWVQLIEQLQQQRLRALADDEDVLAVLMALI